ncbi:unnamed protein product [Tilletia controversa]|uniref:RNA helicase n=3 Tax=Tilletia TaxID=13289 RepID=A0A8X7SXL8_9BASI|nr:hypothetical protein CF336_g3281 [Tilletia laevis]KAE8199952.1 hypothetical protein CF328_g3098 [Tilletia controversa]KAE8262799.1 hypothetical protein A4X03_0g2171 [Tilletia caries]KAE8204829.1 hypothetical protein CF335_g2514 [Tilletia laevis]KAE8248306.1 hypothetical protein A4X06_0g3807 [Tilletia controversa]
MLRATAHAVASSSRCTLNHVKSSLAESAIAVATARMLPCSACSRGDVNSQPARALHSSSSQARLQPTPSKNPRSRPPPRKNAPGRWRRPPSIPQPVKPPNAAQTRDALLSELTTFTASVRVAGRLVALGVKGDAVRALLLSRSECKKLCVETLQRFKGKNKDEGPTSTEFRELVSSELAQKLGDDDVKVLQALLPIWKKSALRGLQNPGAQSSDRRGGFGPNLATGESPGFLIESLSQAYEVEGTKALHRACMHHFLDWLYFHLQKLSQASVSRQRNADEDDTSSPSGAESFSPVYPIGHSASILHAHLAHLFRLTDYMLPASKFPAARALNRQIHLHIGPTNSGKTYGALLALTKAETGVYAGPLRLLAHEVFERINEGSIGGVPPRPCNMLTGEEKRIIAPLAGLMSCTIEMASLDKEVDVGVIDEIQMIADPGRGAAWTAAVLGLPAKELHLCGEASVLPLIRRLTALCNDELHVHTYQRLTPLRVAEQSLGGDLSKIEKGDCIVTFARSNIFFLKRMIEQRTGLKCAVAYGALPPETRSEQARLFNDTSEKGMDVMVASDAIGMGLNLKIKRVIFETCTKWDGGSMVPLSTSQIKQIAGRAGRYGTQEKTGESEPQGGIVTTLNDEDLPFVHSALASGIVPIRRAALHTMDDDVGGLSVLVASTQQMDRQLGIDIWSNVPSPLEEGKDKDKDADEEDEDSDLDEDLEGRGKSRRSRSSQKDRDSKKKSKVEEETKPNAHPNPKVDAILKVLKANDLSDPKSRPAWYESSRSVSTLFSVVTQAIRFDPTLFFLPDYEREGGMSTILEACAQGQLTFEEKITMGKSPAPLRDERVVVFLSNMIRGHGRGELVQFEQCAKGLQLMEALVEVEAAAKERAAERSGSGSKDETVAGVDNDAKEKAAEGLAFDGNKSDAKADDAEAKSTPVHSDKPDAPHPVLNLNSLMVLESLHRCLTVYLWLSYRFPLSFAFRSDVRKLKTRTEVAIEELIAATRFNRRKTPGRPADLESSEFQWVKGSQGKGGERGGQRGDVGSTTESELVGLWKSTLDPRGQKGKGPGRQASHRSDSEESKTADEGEVKVVLGMGAGGVIKDGPA